jgi:hypothetical protein
MSLEAPPGASFGAEHAASRTSTAVAARRSMMVRMIGTKPSHLDF